MTIVEWRELVSKTPGTGRYTLARHQVEAMIEVAEAARELGVKVVGFVPPDLYDAVSRLESAIDRLERAPINQPSFTAREIREHSEQTAIDAMQLVERAVQRCNVSGHEGETYACPDCIGDQVDKATKEILAAANMTKRA